MYIARQFSRYAVSPASKYVPTFHLYTHSTSSIACNDTSDDGDDRGSCGDYATDGSEDGSSTSLSPPSEH